MVIKEMEEEAFKRIAAMTPAERCELDEIGDAIQRYFSQHRPREGGFVLPNRVTCLLALDAAYAHERLVWERD